VVRATADDAPLTGGATTRGEHQPAGGSDLPRARRARRDEHKTLGLQQPQRQSSCSIFSGELVDVD
jgi:hypothetical protein